MGSLLDLVLVLFFLWQAYLGYRGGLARQLGYVLLTILSFVLASMTYRGVAQFLSLWIPYANPVRGSQALFFESAILFDLDQVFYSGLGFVLVYALVYWLGRAFSVFLVLFPWKPREEKPLFSVMAAVLSVLLSWCSVEMFLFIVATVPLSVIQDSLSGSLLAQFMLTLSPFSRLVLRPLWVLAILGR